MFFELNVYFFGAYFAYNYRHNTVFTLTEISERYLVLKKLKVESLKQVR